MLQNERDGVRRGQAELDHAMNTRLRAGGVVRRRWKGGGLAHAREEELVEEMLLTQGGDNEQEILGVSKGHAVYYYAVSGVVKVSGGVGVVATTVGLAYVVHLDFVVWHVLDSYRVKINFRWAFKI